MKSTVLSLLLFAACPVAANSISDDVAAAAAVAEGIEAEEGVCANGAGDEDGACSLELRQLRAKERSAAVAEHQHQIKQDSASSSESFGPDVEGQGLWDSTTWDQLHAQISANMTQQNCEAETGGTCGVFGCGATRGSVECFSGKCRCPVGYCAFMGACFPQKATQCLEDSGGTCSVGSCSSSRGVTKCKEGKCLCKTGSCAWRGQCYPITDTGGSCSLYRCDETRGPTVCHRGRCLCKEGFVSVQGRCTPHTTD